MIPGPYAICEMFFESDDEDVPALRSIKTGYDAAQDAFAALSEVAIEAGVPESDCAVIRWIDPEEADQFSE